MGVPAVSLLFAIQIARKERIVERHRPAAVQIRLVDGGKLRFSIRASAPVSENAARRASRETTRFLKDECRH